MKKEMRKEKEVLSTPHGALGTISLLFVCCWFFLLLSTPHGALGTEIIEYIERSGVWLSTPHGALGTPFTRGVKTPLLYFQLHTVH